MLDLARVAQGSADRLCAIQKNVLDVYPSSIPTVESDSRLTHKFKTD